MSINENIHAAARGAVASALANAAQHAIDVWREPGFQTALRREAKDFFKSVASEVGAASKRVRG